MAVAVTINSYHFRLFVQHYGIKSNPKLCYSYNVPSHPMYSYSMATIDLIVMEIEKDPENILRVLKRKVKKRGEPQGQRILSIKPTPIREPSLFRYESSLSYYTRFGSIMQAVRTLL